MQTFSWKTAKLTSRVTLEVDRRWVRTVARKGQATDKQIHIDFNLIDAIHYWVTQSRGAALTGHLVIRDKQGKKLALQCSGFGMDNDMLEFLRAASAVLAAVGEVRPDLRVAPEPTATHRRLMAGVIMAAVVVVGGVMYFVDTESDWTRIGGPVLGALIAIGVVLFRFGPLRKKPELVAPSDLARAIVAQSPVLLSPQAT
jgi:hypothetical protein